MCNLSRAEKIVFLIVVVSQDNQYLPIIKYESLIAIKCDQTNSIQTNNK